MFSEQGLSGTSYLEGVTRLLQRARATHPTNGVWEAADLQWWWRKPRPTDSLSHPFWFDRVGEPVAAAIATDWGGRIGLDIIAAPGGAAGVVEQAWKRGLEFVVDIDPSGIEVLVDDDDPVMRSLLVEAGFVMLADKGASAWMRAKSRPVGSPTIPNGYSLISRAETGDAPHHFIASNGPSVADRLRETSLYRPDLDLSVIDANGEVVAYGLFWLDPTTGVGFVEPMGTNEAHRRKGLARHILASGINRLSDGGASRIKVNYEQGNEASSTLYLETGFAPVMTTSLWIKNEITDG
jgi:predicted N-acetyltransferase YhbS